MRRHDLLTAKEEKDLVLRLKAGDKAALSRLLECNQAFLRAQAGRWVQWGADMDDLIQEGNIGLMRAAEKFEPKRGLRLLSYAVHWVNACMRLHVLNNHSLLKVGTTVGRKMAFFQLRPTMARLESEGCPSEELLTEAAKELGVSREVAEEIHTRLSGEVSMEFEHDGETHERSFADPKAVADSYNDRQEAEYTRGELSHALSRLTAVERLVIERRLLSDEPCTLVEIGKEVGRSREWVRTTEAKAIEKLRRLMPKLEAA
jgi:RNA polymerase sigma-32 factor